MEGETQKITEEIKTGTVDASDIVTSDGLHLFEQTKEVTLTAEEAKIVRKVLSCVNTLYTVVESEYKENKIDAILRKLRRYEQ